MRSIILVVLAVGGCASVADDGSGGEWLDDSSAPKADDPSITTYFSDGLVDVVSDVALDPQAAAGYAAMLEAAYEFDLDRYTFTTPSTLADRPLELQVLSPARIAQQYPGDLSAALGGWAIVISTTTIDLPGVPGVLAHESSHIMSSRQGGGLPHAIEEGKAGVLQREYWRSLGLPFQPSQLQLHGTADQAASALDGFLFTNDHQVAGKEPLAVMFSEYLRVDAAFPDYVADCAAMIEDVAWRRSLGVTDPLLNFKLAFHDVFGIWFADARTGYLAFMTATQDSPTDRMSGTVFDATQ